jgi:hypothetical protein
MSPGPTPPEGDERDEHSLGRQAKLPDFGAALSDLPVPDHGPTFWADLSARLQGESTVLHHSGPATEARGLHQPPQSAAGSADATTTAETVPVSLDHARHRRAARRTGRSLGAAAAAVALVVGVAGAVAVIRDDGTDGQVSTAGRPTSTTSAPAPAANAPMSFSATYDGIEGWDGPGGCCSTWRLTADFGADTSFRWTSTDGKADMAYDYGSGRHVEVLTVGPGLSPSRPGYLITTGVPAGGPDRRIARPEPLGPMADFVVALARAGDPRITASTVAGRPAWHYDGPTAVDRLGGDGAPNHAVADVDQATGVLLHLTRRVGDLVVNRFTASDVTVSESGDRALFRIEPPAGAKTTTVPLGFDGTDRTLTLDEVAAAVPYDLLVPDQVPDGFRQHSAMLNRDVPSPTGPEGMNPPATSVVVMTWFGPGDRSRFTVTLRPKGAEQWDDPFGGEGVVLGSSPVQLELPGRPPLEGAVAVDAPAIPHLWGITGDIVVTVSGDLSRAELERVAGSLRPHRAG